MAATRIVSQDIKDGTVALADLGMLTAKGDILTHDGSNHQRLAVGTNGQVLTADSAQANGIKWAALALDANQYKCFFAQTATVTVSNTLTETTLIGTGTGDVTVPSNAMTAGSVVRLRAGGRISTLTSSETLRFRVYLGNINVILDSTSGSGIGDTLTDDSWSVQATFVARQSGGTADVIGSGFFCVSLGGTAATYRDILVIQAAAATVVDLTGANDVDLTVQWTSTADTSNNIRCTNLTLEIVTVAALT